MSDDTFGHLVTVHLCSRLTWAWWILWFGSIAHLKRLGRTSEVICWPHAGRPHSHACHSSNQCL